MLTQRRTSGRQIFPAPEHGAFVEETPPVFAFLKSGNAPLYIVTVRNAGGDIVFEGSTERNFLVPDRPLAPGKYEWNLSCGAEERGWWSFEISGRAVPLPRPSVTAVFDAVPDKRPRHLFLGEDIGRIVTDKQSELETLKRNIALALEQPPLEPPRFYTDPAAPDYRAYFGRYRDYCDRDMVACALGHVLLDDERATAKAKELLLTVCSWNPAGPCSLLAPWNDEVGLSNARCLPAVYDLMADVLTDKERYLVEQTIFAYALQCEERLTKLDFTQNPGNSHSGRIPAYLGEAALVLKGSRFVDEMVLRRWLALALEIYGGIFPFFGCEDGGWAEGPFYASSYTRWYLPFFLAVERFSGVRLLDRPFYQRVSQYFLHFAAPERENHPFGDGYWCGSEDPEWPGFFAQNPFRIYGERFGPEPAARQAKKYAAPDIFKLHLLDVFIPAGSAPDVHVTGEASPMAVFDKAGYASCQTNLADQSHGTGLLVRASRYGRFSHQHADQGSFALVRNNKTLLSPSGYFGHQFGTEHHRLWTQTTKAHNCILVDGVGQEENGFRATGRFLEREHDGNRFFRLVADLAAAYPMLSEYRRTFTLTENELVVEDEISSSEPHEISFLLHMLSRPRLQEDGSLLLEHGGERAVIVPLSGFSGEPVISDRYGVDLNEGVPERSRVEMPAQYHVSFTAPRALMHRLKVAVRLG